MNSHMMTNNAYLTEFHTLKPGLECWTLVESTYTNTNT
jgi:hypothetical protein